MMVGSTRSVILIVAPLRLAERVRERVATVGIERDRGRRLRPRPRGAPAGAARRTRRRPRWPLPSRSRSASSVNRRPTSALMPLCATSASTTARFLARRNRRRRERGFELRHSTASSAFSAARSCSRAFDAVDLADHVEERGRIATRNGVASRARIQWRQSEQQRRQSLRRVPRTQTRSLSPGETTIYTIRLDARASRGATRAVPAIAAGRGTRSGVRVRRPDHACGVAAFGQQTYQVLGY